MSISYLTQLSIQVSFPLASLLLCLSIFTLTFPEYHSLRWMRLALGVPTCLLAWAAIHPPNLVLRPGIHAQLFFYGSYLLMRAMEVCFIGYDGDGKDIPRWQLRKEKTEADGVAEFVTLPLPKTLRGRLGYTLDNLVSVRGSSVFNGCSWNWSPKSVRDYRPSSRRAYIRSRVQNLLITFLVLDVSESILVRRKWSLAAPNPMTSLSLPQQVGYTITLGVFTWVGMDLAFGYGGLILVPLFDLPPSSCPPFYDDPFGTTSLADFWSRKWHSKYRRNTLRLSLPPMALVRGIIGEPSDPRILKFIRCLVIFLITTVLHIGIAHAIPLSASGQIQRRLIEPSTIKFFLSQPFGLLFELTAVHPLTEKLPERWKVFLRRAFFWTWMIWTGRWYSDGYLKYGQFSRKEMAFSPVEMTFGRWTK